jgi:hypothetical protein
MGGSGGASTRHSKARTSWRTRALQPRQERQWLLSSRGCSGVACLKRLIQPGSDGHGDGRRVTVVGITVVDATVAGGSSMEAARCGGCCQDMTVRELLSAGNRVPWPGSLSRRCLAGLARHAHVLCEQSTSAAGQEARQLAGRWCSLAEAAVATMRWAAGIQATRGDEWSRGAVGRRELGKKRAADGLNK